MGAGIVAGSVGTHAAAHATAGSDQGPADLYGGTHPAGHLGAQDLTVQGGDRGGVLSSGLPVGDAAGPYAGPYAMPERMPPDALDALTVPPPPTTGPVDIEMEVVERPHQISRSFTLPQAWTYNGTLPGPTIRATEGQTVRVHFTNRTAHDHNLHFHGRHAPVMDGWEPIPPGGETVYEIEAGPAGVHPYHCHTMPIDAHIARGLYGMFIVDPRGGRPDAHEVALTLGGFDIDGSGRNDVYAYNGIAGFYEAHPIRIPTGEPVRAYVMNCIEYDPLASFHLHAQTFDVYPAGMGDAPAWHTDVLSLGQMERAMLEFSLPEVGRYMFHPHQHSIAHRGAMGWFAAV
ncbi:multicopper oxidase domain-containing protein [Euzebya tangerina]|uniref:multicopper oxidase domain-containing protein n=1 Tax=Euzebya tangerina TaxID=591198 RepID=UPI0013C2B07D|nr:multicopper oxidase domain-containing protein [Euzebya tangerina]